MNAVWKDLDPIFKLTLRNYVIANNRSLFNIYAKAVGFNPNHLGLLYLTLRLEQDQYESSKQKTQKQSNNINTTNSANLNTTNTNNRKRRYSQMYNSSDEYSSDCDNRTKLIHKNATNIIKKTVKRRKISSNHRQPPSCITTIHQQCNPNNNVIQKEQPSITSIVCRVYQNPNEKYKTYKKYNQLNNIIPISQNVNNNTQQKINEMNEYQKLKYLSSQAFKNKKLPSSVLRKNKKKITNLLTNLGAYTTKTVQTTTQTTTTTVESYNSRHRKKKLIQ